jgi:hypothetical protein
MLDEISVSSVPADAAPDVDLAVALKMDAVFDRVVGQLFAKSPELFAGAKEIADPKASVAWALTAAPKISLVAPNTLEPILTAAYSAASGKTEIPPDAWLMLKSAAQAGVRVEPCNFHLKVAVSKDSESASLECDLTFTATALLSISAEDALVVTPVSAELTDSSYDTLRKQLGAQDDPFRDLLFFLIDAAVLPMVMQKIQDKLVFPIPDLSFHGVALASPQIIVTPDNKRLVVMARAISNRPRGAAKFARPSLKGAVLPDRDAVVVVSRDLINRAAAAGIEAMGELGLSKSGRIGSLSYDLAADIHVESLDVVLGDASRKSVSHLGDNAAALRIKATFYVQGELTIRTRHLSVGIGFVSDLIEDFPFKATLSIVDSQVFVDLSCDFQRSLKLTWRGADAYKTLVADLAAILKTVEQEINDKVRRYINSRTLHLLALETLPLIPLGEIGGVPYVVGLEAMRISSAPDALTLGVDLSLRIPVPTTPLHRYRFKVKRHWTYCIATDSPGDGWELDKDATGFATPTAGADATWARRCFLSHESEPAYHNRHYYGAVDTGSSGGGMPLPSVPNVDMSGEGLEYRTYHGDREAIFQVVEEQPFRVYRDAQAGAVAVHRIFLPIGRKGISKRTSPHLANLVRSQDLPSWLKDDWVDGGIVFHLPVAAGEETPAKAKGGLKAAKPGKAAKPAKGGARTRPSKKR